MVSLSKESVEEFRRIFKEVYGADYTYEEAWEAAHNLVGFFDLLARLDFKQKQEAERKSEGDQDTLASGT
jgi:hypothetical protein